MILQFVTGICLAFVYAPTADEAWTSLQVLNQQQAFGWFIRALHGWGSNFMVAMVLIHMCQVFLFGAFKFPRELTWIVGVFLLLMTLGMAFTGQVLRFDQDAYWGLGIGAAIVGRVPLIGPAAGQPDARRTHHRGRNAVAILCRPCVHHPRRAGRLCRRASADGAETRRERMAHARPRREARDVPQGISRADAERRRAVHPRCLPQRPRFLRHDHSCRGRVRCAFRSVRTERRARSARRADGARARFFLPLALCRARVAAAVSWRRFLLLVGPVVVHWLPDCCCRSFPAQARRAGGADPSRC